MLKNSNDLVFCINLNALKHRTAEFKHHACCEHWPCALTLDVCPKRKINFTTPSQYLLTIFALTLYGTKLTAEFFFNQLEAPRIFSTVRLIFLLEYAKLDWKNDRGADFCLYQQFEINWSMLWMSMFLYEFILLLTGVLLQFFITRNLLETGWRFIFESDFIDQYSRMRQFDWNVILLFCWIY